MRYLPVALLLAACGTTPAQQATLTAGAVTLAQIAAAKNTTAAALVANGALFCQKVQAVDPLVQPLIVALAGPGVVPVSVINQTSANVANACAAIDAVPVAPPADPASAPVVAATVDLPPA